MAEDQNNILPPETADNSQESNENNENQKPKKKPKKHLIKNKWIRIPLKVLAGIILFILIIPVLLYIPPIQTAIKNLACNIVGNSTGMTISIDKFRLKFPLDVTLDGVTVLDVNKDTMVNARQLIADVRLLPLLKLDVKVNKLELLDGYYRMVSPDSSMILGIRAGLLRVDDRSSVNIKSSDIHLHKTLLQDGKLSLYMNVWKQDTVPTDTTNASTPFVIKADDLELRNFEFGMSMLPTIDTLALKVNNLNLHEGVVNLAQNRVSWKRADINGGSATYLTPTPEYIATHPAPPARPSSGHPMVIAGDSISLKGFKALYATKGAKPLPGFDASYIDVSDVVIGLRNFYNEASTIRLPFTDLQAVERSGLNILSGTGTVGIDSIGLNLKDLNINTLYSNISATADIPFALMAMKPDAPMTANIKARLGLPDIEAFMPDMKKYTSKLPARNPLTLNLDANGSLTNMNIDRLDVALKGVVELYAKGFAENPTEIKKMRAAVDFDGKLADPSLVSVFTGTGGIKIPAFTIKGNATANKETYTADFSLLSTAGDVAAKGLVSLNSERYDVDATLDKVNVAQFLPDLGIGKVSASIKGTGAGFNPLSGKAVTSADINIHGIEYNKKFYKDIRADITLKPDGIFDIFAISSNPGLEFDIDGTGSIHKDDYTFDLTANLRDIDLESLGISKDMNRGSGTIYLAGSASPDQWLYDINLKLRDFDWNLPDSYIHLPGGLTATVLAAQSSTSADISTNLSSIHFNSPEGLKSIIDKFSKAADNVTAQISKRNLYVDSISRDLPVFELKANASGRGLLNRFLTPSGMSLDTVWAVIAHDSILTGRIEAREFTSASVNLDSLNINLNERGELLDYKIHIGNRPGTFDEFAQINLNGYLGSNRVAAYLNQRNIKGETGYRLGLTAALMDSTLSLHFTPLKSTIAYLPWTFNGDNFVEYNIITNHIDANLLAKSAESSVLLRTESLPDGNQELHAKIDNLRLEDFLKMSVTAPPVSGALNTDLHIVYHDRLFNGDGTLSLNNLTYDKTRIGDFNLDLNAAYTLTGNTNVSADMKINGQKALGAFAVLSADSIGMKPDSIGVKLTKFPLEIINPFLNNSIVLGGRLNGAMRMDGSFIHPRLNGIIAFDSVNVRVPMAGSTFRFVNDSVRVADNIVKFNQFNIFGANSNPLTIDGSVDASSFSAIALNLGLNAQNFQAIGNTSKANSDIYGKLFLDIGATVRGPLNHFDIKGNVNILGTSDITYVVNTESGAFTANEENNVVSFVNFNDTTQVEKADSVAPAMTMRINAALRISPGTKATVILPSAVGGTNVTNRVELQPTANLNYFQNFMGDMRMNGSIVLGEGFVRYAIPVIGQKKFIFNPQSNVTWGGNVMNPALNIEATDEMKANVTSGSNSRLVNFLVTLYVNGTLSAPSIRFDLSTNDDLSVQNELSSMSADQRQTQAMNLLLYGQYTSGDTKGNANLSGNMLYGFLESQLNQWAAKTIKGVDLSFGIDQYDKLSNGASNTETSYSYQVSKSLFNNRFKVQVGGNYSTDASADENLSQNLISDISLEYILKQTQTINMAIKLFRHTGYESILEGEITETGVGFIMKRKLDNLLHLFRFRRRKNNTDNSATAKDIVNSNDSTLKERNVDTIPVPESK